MSSGDLSAIAGLTLCYVTHFRAGIMAGFRQNIFLTRFVDLSTMAAFSSYKSEFISAALQGKVAERKGVCVALPPPSAFSGFLFFSELFFWIL